MKHISGALVLVMGWSVWVNGGQLINVDFQPGGAGGDSAIDYDGQGVLEETGDDAWNIIDPDTNGAFNGPFGSGGSLSFANPYVSAPLVDAEGFATPVTVTVELGDPEAAFAVSSTNASIVDIATNAVGLMSDYLIAQDDATSFTINNLTTGGIYNLVLFGAGDLDFRNTTFIVGDRTQTTQGIPLGGHGLTEGFDYVVFNGVVADGGSITVRYLNGGESTDGNVNGFQLQEADSVEVNALQVANTSAIAFNSIEGAVYRLQYNTDLLSTNWQTAPVVYYGTGGTAVAFDPAGFSTQKSYRVVQQ